MIKKPVDRIKEIKDSLMKDEVWEEHEAITTAIVSYLNECYEYLLKRESNSMPIVDLLKEIEHQKMMAEGRAVKITEERIKTKLNSVICESKDECDFKTKILFLLFGKDPL